MDKARYLNQIYMLQTAELIDKINKIFNTFPLADQPTSGRRVEK